MGVSCWPHPCIESLPTLCYFNKVSRPRTLLKLEAKAMKDDDETTATQLHKILISHGIELLLSAIIHRRSMLG